MNSVMEDILMHYGVKRRSGRYPWGSGDNPYQHSGDFLSRVEELKKEGRSEKEIAEGFGLSTTEYRVAMQTAKHERRQLDVDRARSLRDDGKSLNEIAEIMGFKNDSSVRALLNANTEANKNKARKLAEMLKEEVEKKGVIDIGEGVERSLGVSKEKLQEAIYILEAEEGYVRGGIGIPQVTNKRQQTNTMVLCKNEDEWKQAYDDNGRIQSVVDYHSPDGGSSFIKREYPASIDSNRISIRYGDQGGIDKDGVIELRRGVPDLDLGNSHYAQVRILVDGTHYLKGMAMYSDDMPDGVDVVFNTNKKSGTNKMDVLKEIQNDPDNPFGAYIKANGQSYYDDPNGKYTDPITGKKQSLSAINKLKEEGDWDTMSKNLSSQFLSKQPMKLIKQQLNLTYADRESEYDEICSLTNPTVKRKLLMDFANECDGAVVHLKAAALPRQKTQVILPLTKIKETEVYAPNFQNGERVALVRYPHGGTFEIPVLTVNNKNRSAIDILGPNIKDAIGINSKVAERLSGADFDGDQVVAIPIGEKSAIKSTPALRGLEGFDPKTQYSTEGKTGVRLMTKAQTQKQMGMISNLITDMTLAGAPESEIARAVKHSMVVIDAAKHKLDYRQSEKDNGIAELKAKYQPHYDEDGNIKAKGGGASTLLSRRKQDVDVPERRGSGRINIKGTSWYDPAKPEGAVLYKESGRTYADKKTGEIKTAMTKVKRLSVTDDLRTLSSGTPQENAYADYGNKMKALANRARKEYATTEGLQYNANSKSVYQKEVDVLSAKLNVAAANAPKERRAQAIANSVVKAKTQEYPDMDDKELKKIKQIAITDARLSVGASGKDSKIAISPKEWEAIQAGAISNTKLEQILRYADMDVVKQMAMPKTTTVLSSARINKIKTMAASGYTNDEIAKAVGASTSTISKYLND